MTTDAPQLHNGEVIARARCSQCRQPEARLELEVDGRRAFRYRCVTDGCIAYTDTWLRYVYADSGIGGRRRRAG